MRYDPYAAAVAPAIVASFNDYYRQELKVESDRQYVLSGGDVGQVECVILRKRGAGEKSDVV